MTKIAHRLLLALLACIATGASAQLIEPRTENEKVLVESVKKRLSPCFTLLGVDRSIPVAATRPPHRELLAAVLLRASGPMVSDGYSYMLLIHGPSNSAFVEQFGGFTGSPVRRPSLGRSRLWPPAHEPPTVRCASSSNQAGHAERCNRSNET